MPINLGIQFSQPQIPSHSLLCPFGMKVKLVSLALLITCASWRRSTYHPERGIGGAVFQFNPILYTYWLVEPKAFGCQRYLLCS